MATKKADARPKVSREQLVERIAQLETELREKIGGLEAYSAKCDCFIPLGVPRERTWLNKLFGEPSTEFRIQNTPVIMLRDKFGVSSYALLEEQGFACPRWNFTVTGYIVWSGRWERVVFDNLSTAGLKVLHRSLRDALAAL